MGPSILSWKSATPPLDGEDLSLPDRSDHDQREVGVFARQRLEGVQEVEDALVPKEPAQRQNDSMIRGDSPSLAQTNRRSRDVRRQGLFAVRSLIIRGAESDAMGKHLMPS